MSRVARVLVVLALLALAAVPTVAVVWTPDPAPPATVEVYSVPNAFSSTASMPVWSYFSGGTIPDLRATYHLYNYGNWGRGSNGLGLWLGSTPSITSGLFSGVSGVEWNYWYAGLGATANFTQTASPWAYFIADFDVDVQMVTSGGTTTVTQSMVNSTGGYGGEFHSVGTSFNPTSSDITAWAGKTLFASFNNNGGGGGYAVVSNLKFYRANTALMPNMQNVVVPSPEPTLPGEFDTFTPPVDSSTPSASSPAFAEWTRTVPPDTTMVATGSNLSSYTGNDAGKDTRYLIYGQTSSDNGLFSAASIQRLDGMKSAATFPAGLPSWSMYFVWPKNAYGYGYPVAVNRTEAWWLGPNNYVTRGDTVAVYGRNLSHDNGVISSWVYIKPSGSAGQWATVTAVNPYKVDFTIPAGLLNGTYDVWIHNGHGGHYGWSGPLSLTVTDGNVWTARTYNVRDYGAVGDGVTDDTAAIIATAQAAAAYSYSTVYFPAGTYACSSSVNPYPNQRWSGAGKTQTAIISLPNNWNGTYALIFNGDPNTEIKDMAIRASAGYTYGSLVYWRGMTNCRFTNVTFDSDWTVAVDMHWSQYLFFKDCDFIGYQSYLGNASNVFVDGCNWYGIWDANVMLESWGGSNISVTNSTAQDYDNSDPNSGAGWSQGRWMAGNNVWGCGRNTYIGDNATYDLCVRPGYGNQNTGEQIMWEGSDVAYRANALSSTSTTVTFASLGTDYSNAYNAVIVSGTGLGQSRKITACNTGTGVITVSPAWNLKPDTTSNIIFMTGTDQFVCYNNSLDGKLEYYTNNTASAGIEPYGGCINVIADHNTITECRTGISSWACGDTNPYGMASTLFNLYCYNTIDTCEWGTRTFAAFYDGSYPDPGLSFFGNIFRGNSITDTSISNVSGGVYAAPWQTMDTNVYEFNTGTNTPDFFDTELRSEYNTLFYKNNASLGTATYSGSKGVALGTGSLPEFRQNTWTGFETTYTGTLPGALLELPSRNCDVTATAGGSAQTGGLTIWNSGTSSLSWTASDDAAWLTLSSTSGTITDENGSSSITLTCDPTGLSTGTYTGTVTVTGASQTKKAIVTFTVAANAAPSCSITSPSGGFSYTAPATINITASASDIGGYVTSVEFYNNGILLGTDSNGADGWTYSWTNVEASGSNGIVLTAKAYDNLNAVTTSSSVTGTVTDSALKGYWKLDSSSGTSATDSSGTGNTGTTYNSPTWGACKVLNGLTYNGSNQYAQKTSAVSLPTAGANQTLSCWIYVSSAPTVRKTAMCMTGSSSGNYIGYLNSTTFGVWRYGGTAIVTTTSLPTTGAWHHVAYVKNGSNKYLYIDGSQAATSTATTNTASSTTINAGRTTSGADYWPGKVDEVRIYNRVLTLTEIQSLAAGKQ